MDDTQGSARELVSVIVPVFGHARTLDELSGRIRSAVQAAERAVEIIFVDDGSPDESWSVINRLVQAGNNDVCGVRLTQNVGQHAAVLVGLSQARGSWCVVIDADLQDPPEAIPALLAAGSEDHDVVFAGRRGDYTTFGRRLTGRLYRLILSTMVGVPRDAAICLALRRREVARLLDLRVATISLVAMIGLIGSRSTSVPVARAANRSGTSSYTGRQRATAGLRMLRCVLEARLRLVREPIGAQIDALGRASISA